MDKEADTNNNGQKTNDIKGSKKLSVNVQKFLELTQINFSKHYTIKEYAAMIGVTDNHLIKICRKEYGKTALGVLHDIMIDEAKKQLSTDASVKEIAITLGFKDLANFNHFFKNKIGKCPTEYRAILDK